MRIVGVLVLAFAASLLVGYVLAQVLGWFERRGRIRKRCEAPHVKNPAGMLGERVTQAVEGFPRKDATACVAASMTHDDGFPLVDPIGWGLRMNILALVKGSERYVFFYDNESRRELQRTLGRFAADPELSLTWYDASILSQKVRAIAEQ